MNKEFIPYEQALELKELGFDEPCFGYWDRDPYLPKPTFNLVKPFEHKWCVPTPLYQQAFRWFREKYGISSYIEDLYNDEINIPTGLFEIGIRSPWDRFYKCYSTYEEAELACLKLNNVNKLLKYV
jgi:hypothetical protein